MGEPSATGTAGEGADTNGSDSFLGTTGLLLFLAAIAVAALFARGMRRKRAV